MLTAMRPMPGKEVRNASKNVVHTGIIAVHISTGNKFFDLSTLDPSIEPAAPIQPVSHTPGDIL
jgi:hypothetical protein